ILFSSLKPHTSTYSLNWKFEFLKRQIDRLELPQMGKDCVWDHLPNPESQIETLAHLGVELWQSSHIGKNKREHLVGGLYTLYAIMAHLARRCPRLPIGKEIPGKDGEKKKFYRLNAYPLAAWMGSFGAKIDDPRLAERMRKAGELLLPDLNFDQLP